MAGPINGLGTLAQPPIANTFQPGQQAQNQRANEAGNQNNSGGTQNVAQVSEEGTQGIQEANNDQSNVIQSSDAQFAVDSSGSDSSEGESGERGSLVDIAV